MANLLLLAQLATTLFMTGVIWIVQVVHYPLFANVGAAGFGDYARLHANLISLIVMPPMLIEIGAAFLFVWMRPSSVPAWAAWLGLALVLLVWASTFLQQVPQHGILAEGFNVDAHRVLVSTNWIRTAAWTGRGGLLLWLVWQIL